MGFGVHVGPRGTGRIIDGTLGTDSKEALEFAVNGCPENHPMLTGKRMGS